MFKPKYIFKRNYCKQYNTGLERKHTCLYSSSPYKIDIVSIWQVFSEKNNMVQYEI